jgi:hypothetical protein
MTAMREPPARRPAIWQAKVSVPRPQLMAAAAGWAPSDSWLTWCCPSSRFTVEAVEHVAAGFGDQQLKIA